MLYEVITGLAIGAVGFDGSAWLALLQGINTRDLILVSSRRISSEMLGKARQMGA